MVTFWFQGGKLIHDANDKFIYCDECPCVEDVIPLCDLCTTLPGTFNLSVTDVTDGSCGAGCDGYEGDFQLNYVGVIGSDDVWESAVFATACQAENVWRLRIEDGTTDCTWRLSCGPPSYVCGDILLSGVNACFTTTRFDCTLPITASLTTGWGFDGYISVCNLSTAECVLSS